MKIPLTLLLLVLYFCGSSLVGAAATKNYQVTGPIIALTEKVIVVQKGDEQWEIGRDSKTKADSQLKIGEKVTVHYRMIATSVDVKTTGTLSEPSKKAAESEPTSTPSSAANKTAVQ